MKIKSQLFKHCFITISICLAAVATAFCQKPLAVYYLKASNYILPDVKDADYILLILPPDKSIDKSLFIVKEYYANHKVRFISGTRSSDIRDISTIGMYAKPILQGGYVSYFQNGHKMEVANYENGKRTGGEMLFYPNGKLYCSKTYNNDEKALYNECRDSIGKVLVANGNGNGIIFSDVNFKDYISGSVINGLPQGDWHGRQADTANTVSNYKDGELQSKYMVDKNGEKIYFLTGKASQFPGGANAFARFLSRTVRYPAIARESNRQGTVIIGFVLNIDGTLSDFTVKKSVSKELDAEAIRVLKLSPKWIPDTVNGQPVKLTYNVPIGFTLDIQR